MIRTSFGTLIPRKTIANVVQQVQDVVHSPSYDDDVVDGFEENHSNSRVSDALEDGANLSDHAHSTDAKVLSNGNLQQEQRYSTSEHGDEVGD